jgi:hypothetical protein
VSPSWKESTTNWPLVTCSEDEIGPPNTVSLSDSSTRRIGDEQIPVDVGGNAVSGPGVTESLP